MLDKQTAYTKWLGIKVQDQPPTLYRLLGVDALESDLDTISYAADSRMALLRQFQIGDNAPLAEEILNELSKARVTLLNAEKKAAYDARLRQRIAAQSAAVGAPNTPTAPAVSSPPRAEAIAGPNRAAHVLPASSAVDLESMASEFRSTSSSSVARQKKKISPLVWVAVATSIALVVGTIIVVNSLSGGEDSPPANPAKAVASSTEPLKLPEHPVSVKPATTPSSDKPSSNPLNGEPNVVSSKPAEKITPDPIPAPTVVAPQVPTPPGSEKPSPSPPVDTPKPPVAVVPQTTDPTPAPTPDSSGNDASKKLAPPNADQIKRAEVAINGLYKKELAHPTKDFGQQLLRAAQGTKGDDAGQYTLLRKAIAVSAANDDIEAVNSAMESLDARFELNVLPIWVEVLESLSKRTDVSWKIQDVIGKAYERDDYKSAENLAELLLSSVRRAKDPAAIKTATTKVREAKAAQDEFEKAAGARLKLQERPTDPDANRIVGSFLCFVKKDWDRGVPMLALGDDDALKNVAILEREPKDDLAIGDAWNKIKGGQERSLYWYKKALPGLSGIQKGTVQKLVDEINDSLTNSLKGDWIVIFRASDPSIWNTNVNAGFDRFAVPLDTVRDDVEFLRMRADAKRVVIIGVTREQLGTSKDADRFGWNGTNDFGYGARTLGIFDKPDARQTARGVIRMRNGDGVVFSGWGFGIRTYIDDRQGYVWAGQEIPATVFEISVKSSPLQRAEQASLLK
jgi:hypothetical protein